MSRSGTFVSKSLFLQPPPTKYTCALCQEVAVMPYQVNCCGRIHCEDCVKQMSRCPNCSSQHNPANCFYDKRAAVELGNLSMRCPMHLNGCTWEGQLSVLDNHVKDSCQYGSVTCEDCGMSCMRCSFKKHQSSACRERLSTCQYCESDVKAEMLFEHFKSCMQYPVLCPNKGCSEETIRSDMTQHLLSCAYAEATCAYHDIGCHAKLIRKLVGEHDEENYEKHLQMVIDKVRELEIVRHHGSSLSCKLSRFKHLKLRNEAWYSPAFYSSRGGFKMRLNVYPNGLDSAEGTHLSCFIRLMPGQYDDTLEWPFRGEVTVELLNQLEDKHHFKGVILFTSSTPLQYSGRVVDKEYGLGWGIPKFISLEELAQPSAKNCQYMEVKDDSLYFRLSVHCRSKTRPWLQTEM